MYTVSTSIIQLQESIEKRLRAKSRRILRASKDILQSSWKFDKIQFEGHRRLVRDKRRMNEERLS